MLITDYVNVIAIPANAFIGNDTRDPEGFFLKAVLRLYICTVVSIYKSAHHTADVEPKVNTRRHVPVLRVGSFGYRLAFCLLYMMSILQFLTPLL